MTMALADTPPKKESADFRAAAGRFYGILRLRPNYISVDLIK
jgi:hypothetical protein